MCTSRLLLAMLKALCRLHSEVDAFIKYISPTPVEDEVRSLIVESVSRAVSQAFPDAKVLPFGSYETKLYLPLG
jgi:non-canonical poly(A) RNA polymerase PAPD5/7